MNNYLLRNYIEICHIMLHEKMGVEEFSAYFSLSPYELASDMDKIRDMENSFGIHIRFGPTQIEYRIQNAELFHQKYRYCRSFYYRHRTTFRKNKDILL